MIRITDLQITFPGFSLGPVSLHVPKGSFFALMGPTGSGKTLLLESLAGLATPHAGSIHIDGKDVTYATPEKRRIGLVYQDHALFPHMTVLQNITYGQRYHGIAPEQGEPYARELMEMLSLSHLERRKPARLSGGERQRVALARALAFRPEIVLLDEPLSSLDPQFREGLRKQLKTLHQSTDTTFFMVTHDFVDALTLADSAAVIRHGNLEQLGATMDIFQRPATPFIADFVGMKNCLPVQRTCDGLLLEGAALPIPYWQSDSFAPESTTPDIPPKNNLLRNTTSSAAIEITGEITGNTTYYVALRPEDIHLTTADAIPNGSVTLSGTINSITRQGFSWLACVQCGATQFIAQLEQRHILEQFATEGSKVTLSFQPSSLHVMASGSRN